MENISLLSSIGMCSGVLLAGFTHYWVALVGSYSMLLSCQAENAIGLFKESSKVGSVCVCVSVCVYMYACPRVCLWLKLNYHTLIVLYCYLILSHYCCECKYYLLLDTRLIVARGIKETLNSSGLNGCCGLAAASLLNLSLGSVALGSLSCISPSFFSLHFPSQFLFVVGENCASMWSKAFSVKWPVFKCSGGVLLNCSNKLLLIWRCGVVSLLSRRFIHLAKH